MSDAPLIVDDERHALQSLRRRLRRDGCEIHLAESGLAAPDILPGTEIAAFVCDQPMPGIPKPWGRERLKTPNTTAIAKRKAEPVGEPV